MHTEIGDKEMSRNMKEENAKFFRNVCDSLDSELACRATDCVRYISTNEEDKEKGNSSGSETLSELSFHIPKDTDDDI